MSMSIVASKPYIPPSRPKIVLRPRLIQRLNDGLHRAPGLTLISAPAGFGKTTLVSDWLHQNNKDGEMKDESGETIHPARVAWLSLDEGDNDPTRFLMYLVAALQTIAPNFGAGVLDLLQAAQPQPPPIESILTTLISAKKLSNFSLTAIFRWKIYR